MLVISVIGLSIGYYINSAYYNFKVDAYVAEVQAIHTGSEICYSVIALLYDDPNNAAFVNPRDVLQCESSKKRLLALNDDYSLELLNRLVVADNRKMVAALETLSEAIKLQRGINAVVKVLDLNAIEEVLKTGKIKTDKIRI